MVPIILLRYSQLLAGISNYLPLSLSEPGEEPGAYEELPKTGRLEDLERQCREQAIALQEAQGEIDTIKREKGPRPRAHRTLSDQRPGRTKKSKELRKRAEGRDTRADARYSSDETEGSDCDEYSRNSKARYDSFLVPDGEDEEEYEPSDSEEEVSTVTGTTGTRKEHRESVTGKSSRASDSTLPPAVHDLLEGPSPTLRKDLRWEFSENRKLVSY